MSRGPKASRRRDRVKHQMFWGLTCLACLFITLCLFFAVAIFADAGMRTHAVVAGFSCAATFFCAICAYIVGTEFQPD